MLRRAVLFACVVMLCTSCSVTGQERNAATAAAATSRDGQWLYLNSFRSGQLHVIDLATAKTVRVIPVEDRAGSIGALATADGRTIYIVDGDARHHLRAIETSSGRQTAAHPFQDRVLMLGGGPVAHLTADGRYLLVNTYDYGAAASGARIFDLAAGKFLPLGLRGRQCAAPRFASAPDGTLIEVCAGIVGQLRPVGTGRGDFVPGRHVAIPIRDVTDVALSADGNDLYVLERVRQGQAWRLVHWKKGEDTVTAHELSRALQMGPEAPDTGGQAWLKVSPDGKTVALVHGQRAWLLDRQTLGVQRQVTLPWPADGATFTPDGRELLSLRGHAGGAAVEDAMLVRISVDTGAVREVRLQGLTLPSGPTIFEIVRAPS